MVKFDAAALPIGKKVTTDGYLTTNHKMPQEDPEKTSPKTMPWIPGINWNDIVMYTVCVYDARHLKHDGMKC